VPHNVIRHIAMIQPTTRFAQLQASRNGIFEIENPGMVGGGPTAASNPDTNVSVACGDGVIPYCIRALYSIGDYYANLDAGSLFGVAGCLR
jgi:hypothetical protein